MSVPQDEQKAEDELAKKRAAFLLKQQRKAEEARVRKLQLEAEVELKRDEARWVRVRRCLPQDHVCHAPCPPSCSGLRTSWSPLPESPAQPREPGAFVPASCAVGSMQRGVVLTGAVMRAPSSRHVL